MSPKCHHSRLPITLIKINLRSLLPIQLSHRMREIKMKSRLKIIVKFLLPRHFRITLMKPKKIIIHSSIRQLKSRLKRVLHQSILNLNILLYFRSTKKKLKILLKIIPIIEHSNNFKLFKNLQFILILKESRHLLSHLQNLPKIF